MEEKRVRSWRTNLWVSSTYFIEGLPYMVVRYMSSVYFTDRGVREALLGFLNLLGIPWNLKFLWAPLLDLFGTKRRWMLNIQSLITLLIFFIAILAGIEGRGEGSSKNILYIITFIFIGLAFLSATNDIAIDAYYMEGLRKEAEQAAYTGVRIMAYRIAVIYAKSILIAIAGVTNWFFGFGAGALTILIFLIFHRLYLPRFESQRERDNRKDIRTILDGFTDAFITYLSQERIYLVLPFIVAYKLGDEILFSMNTPFLMRELGVTKAQLAWIAGLAGSVASIVGALLGAWWIKMKGLKRSIWPITIIMNTNIWLYVWLAIALPSPSTMKGLLIIGSIHTFENIAAGLGNAVLVVYLMSLCNIRYKAAHYAIGSAIMSLGSTLVGGFGGVIVEHLGYVWLFIIGFFASIPSMVLLLWIPLHERKE